MATPAVRSGVRSLRDRKKGLVALARHAAHVGRTDGPTSGGQTHERREADLSKPRPPRAFAHVSPTWTDETAVGSELSGECARPSETERRHVGGGLDPPPGQHRDAHVPGARHVIPHTEIRAGLSTTRPILRAALKPRKPSEKVEPF